MTMSEPAVLVVRPEDNRKVIYGAGDTYRFLGTGAETDGQYFFLEGTVPPGAGPPPHLQTKEEEAFYILEGTITFYTASGPVDAGPGTYVNIPKGARHRFRNNSDETARLLIFFAPAGIEGLFEGMGSENPLDQQHTPSLDDMNRVGEEYGLNGTQFHNFIEGSRIMNCTPEQALWGIALKHLISRQ